MNNAARDGARWMLLSLPLTLGLVFSRTFSASFSAPKNAIFVLTTTVLVAIALICACEWRPKREEWLFWAAVVVFVADNLFSAWRSPARLMCLQSVEYSVCGVLLLLVSRAVLGGADRDRNVYRLQVAVSVAAALVSLVTMAQLFGVHLPGFLGGETHFSGRMRMYGTLGNPDFVATFLAVAVSSAVGLILSASEPRWRGLWISGSVLTGVAILLTGSRGGWIASAVGVCVIAFFGMQRRQILVAVAVVGVVACALGAGERLNSRTPAESLRGRILIWQVALDGGAARSALGGGPGTFAYEYPMRLGRFFAVPGREGLLRFADAERHAQNDYVETWQEAGWLGLASLLVLLGCWFALAIRRFRTSEAGAKMAVSVAIASVASLCVASLFDFPMHRAETWALLWLFMAVPLALPVLLQVPQRRTGWLRCLGAMLLMLIGCRLAFAPMAASYDIAKGEAEEDRGQLESALVDYRTALRWEASSADANFDLVRVVAKVGDYSGALAQSKVAARYVNEPELSILRSRILQNAGQNREALNEVESAIRIFPYSVDLREEAASYSAFEGISAPNSAVVDR